MKHIHLVLCIKSGRGRITNKWGTCVVLVVMTTVTSSLQGSSGNEMLGPQSHSLNSSPGITGSSRGTSARKVWRDTLVCSSGCLAYLGLCSFSDCGISTLPTALWKAYICGWSRRTLTCKVATRSLMAGLWLHEFTNLIADLCTWEEFIKYFLSQWKNSNY